MKKLLLLYILFALFALSVALCVITARHTYSSNGVKPTGEILSRAFADAKNDNADGDGADKDADIDDSVDELLKHLNLGDVQSIVDLLNADQLAVFGFGDIYKRVQAVASGEFKSDFSGLLSYVFALFGADVFEFLPMLLAVLSITLAYNLINSVKGKYASESIELVVYFATGAIAISLVVGYFSSVLAHAVRYIVSLKTQINAVAPVLLTLMTAAGATSSAVAYTPTIALLGGGMTNIVTYIAFPALLMALVFDVIGSIATAIKLGKTADFFRSACKWLLGTAFFLFIAVIGVTGITASVRDGITVRAARFAVSKYVPVIGGYLSQGFDFIMAGNVLIKNALGSSAVLLVILLVAPIISKLVIFTLTLNLTAAIAEPLGGERFCGILSSVSKSSSMISTVVIAMTFLYIMFLSMIICTGNIGL